MRTLNIQLINKFGIRQKQAKCFIKEGEIKKIYRQVNATIHIKQGEILRLIGEWENSERVCRKAVKEAVFAGDYVRIA